MAKDPMKDFNTFMVKENFPNLVEDIRAYAIWNLGRKYERERIKKLNKK